MEFENKKLRDVAEIARQIMMGEKVLHPNQQKLDVHEPEKDKLTAKDFELLRKGKEAEVKKEEVSKPDFIDLDKDGNKKESMKKAIADKGMKEELKSETFEFHLTEGSYADLHKKWGDTHNIEYHSHTLYPKHTVTKFDNEKDAESHAKKTGGTVRMNVSPKMKNEEVEELDEVKMADLPSRKVQGRAYGAYKPEPHAVDTLAGPKTKELKAIEAEKPIKKDPKNYVKDTGQKRNYKVHAGRYFSNLDTGVSSKGLEEPRYKNESFANILASYSEGGLKGLFETLNQNKVIVEEPDSEQFAQEVKTAQDKSEGKGKKAEVAAAGIEAVKQEGVEVVEYPLDANEINGYSEVTIGESVEQIEELSKNTLGSYIKKANYAGGMADFKHGRIADKRGDSKEKTSLAATAHKREKGISTAVDKLSKEEVEPTQLMSFKARYKK